MRIIASLLALYTTGAVAAPADEIAAAERGFAADAATRGVWTAFRTVFAADAVLFRPGPQNAQTALKGRPDPKWALHWGPEIAEASCDGSLGWDTGPTLLVDGSASAPGHFFSIWRRDAPGWRVVADFGIGHEAPIPIPNTAKTLPPPCADIGKETARLNLLGRTQLEFEAAIARGAKAGYERYAASNMRFQHEGELPATDHAAISIILDHAPKDLVQTRLGGGVSRDATLAYAFGSTTWRETGSARHGQFLQVWRWTADGWRIAIAQVKPDPVT